MGAIDSKTAKKQTKWQLQEIKTIIRRLCKTNIFWITSVSYKDIHGARVVEYRYQAIPENIEGKTKVYVD